jgi:hypothetical protein
MAMDVAFSGRAPTTRDIDAAGSPDAAPVTLLMREFLAWLARAPRTYDETMTAWRTSCPRQSVWEDALADGLIRLDRERGTPLGQTRVVLTARGRCLLDGVMTP